MPSEPVPERGRKHRQGFSTVNAFLEQISKFGIGRLSAIFGLTAGAAATLVMFTMSMNGDGEALLFSNLQPADAATVTERLDGASIPYELREGGSAVYVSQDQVDEARLRVASGGALGFGSVGYEIFDETDALGTTSFVQNVNARRALEGELARSINTINSVSASRVHLVLPERRLFSQQSEEPSASVVLTVRGEIGAAQVETIRNLIATAVPALSSNRITVADDRGRLLASPSDGETASVAALETRRSGVEEDLRQKVRDVVEGVVGSGAARVVVTARLNRESVTESSQRFDPDGQVLRSTETSEETETERNAERGGQVSASENLPDDDAAGQGGPQSSRNRSIENEVRNFEISSTTTTRVVEAGQLERLAVSVVVDHAEIRSPEGTLSFEPRSDTEIEQIRDLVRAAVGFDAERGDIVEVRQMAFSRPDVTLGSPAPTGFALARSDMFRIAELAVLFLTALLIVFLVARPLVRGVVGGGQPALAGAGGGDALALPRQSRPASLPDGQSQAALPGAQESEETIDIDQIDGQVKRSSVKKVANLVQDHPDESMSILRNWMHES